MTSPNNPRGFDWEQAGREVGERLDVYHALVVVGIDPVATGRVAIGIGRTQAQHRRVAVGDLFAESPPIQDLVTSDDPHGLVDSFTYGVSLTRIASPVPDAGQLFVMPSGTEPPEYEEMLRNPRWPRLAAGFREVGALLVLAAPASAPHIEDLVAATDGAILVGEAVPASLPAARVAGTVREPKAQQVREIYETQARSVQAVEDRPRRIRLPLSANPWTRARLTAGAGIVFALILAGFLAWLAYRPAGSKEFSVMGERDQRTDSAPIVAVSPDTTHRGTVADSAAGATAPLPFVPPIANPSDSAIAAAYAVELVTANTQKGAILKLQEAGENLPAATFAPTLIDGAEWFKVVSGAFVNREDADSLLARLRRGRLLVGGERVVRLPFAFLIDSGPASAVPRMVTAYRDRGQPAYGLRQSNGTAWLLVGAFESAAQSMLYVESLHATGVKPVLVYRKGRAF